MEDGAVHDVDSWGFGASLRDDRRGGIRVVWLWNFKKLARLANFSGAEDSLLRHFSLP